MHCGVQRATTLSLTCLALFGALLAPAAARASAIATAYTQGVTPGAGPADIALGPDGNLWFTESNAPGRIGRITPAGQVTEFAGLTFNSQPAGGTPRPAAALSLRGRARPRPPPCVSAGASARGAGAAPPTARSPIPRCPPAASREASSPVPAEIS